MDKQQLLSLIKEKAQEGTITLSEVKEQFKKNETHLDDTNADSSTSKLSYVLYGIGALIALVGVLVLIVTYWEDIGFVGRIGVTLGIAFTTYISALCMKEEHSVLSSVLLIVSAILAPIGIIVVLRNFNIEFNVQTQMWSSLALAIIFCTAYSYTKRNIAILLSLLFTGWTYYTLIDTLFPVTGDIAAWTTCIVGIAYVSCAYLLKEKNIDTDINIFNTQSIKNILYILGTSMTLGSLLTLGGIFDLIIILPLFCAFYLSLFIKSKIMLGLSALFLVIYIFKMTGIYFANSIGWPFALIIIGLLIIGIGYYSIYLSKKYIENKSQKL